MKPTKILLSLLLVAGLSACSSDDPLTVSFTKPSQTVVESAGTATITAALSAKSDKDVSVPFTVTGTAVNPDDYTITASPLTIKAGDTTAKITITLVNDHLTESNETVIVTMGTPTVAKQGKILISKATISNAAVPALASQWISESGDIYIADTYNCAIRKVDHATGFISTVAGDGMGTCGDTGEGGLATAATLAHPVAVVLDADENMYISDIDNCKVKKVKKSTGIITTVVGTGTCGFAGDGGLATAAQIFHSFGLLIDRDGNLLIADTSNNRVRIVTFSDGKIDTIAGDGTGGSIGDGGLATAAQINYPGAIALDTLDNLYVAESQGQYIRKVDSTTGKISTIAGDGTYNYSGDGGLATAAQFRDPLGLVFDGENNLYIADTWNYIIRKINSSDGKINTIAGTPTTTGYTGDGADAGSALLDHPDAVTIDTNGDIYIYDSYNEAVRKIDINTNVITTVAGDSTDVSGYTGDNGPATSAKLNALGSAPWWD